MERTEACSHPIGCVKVSRGGPPWNPYRVYWCGRCRTSFSRPAGAVLLIEGQCGYISFHKTATGREVVFCTRSALHEGKHESEVTDGKG